MQLDIHVLESQGEIMHFEPPFEGSDLSCEERVAVDYIPWGRGRKCTRVHNCSESGLSWKTVLMIVGNEEECKELVVTEGRGCADIESFVGQKGQFKFYPELNRKPMQLME